MLSNRLPLVLGVLLALFWSALSLSGALDRASWLWYHALFELRGVSARPANITVIAIDEASLEELGAWPIPRKLYGDLLDGLAKAGASAVAFDIAMPQAQYPENDQALSAALKRHASRAVLAANFQPVQDGQSVTEQLVLPMESFRVAPYGVVNVEFDADGAIHRLRPQRPGFDPEDFSRVKPIDSFDLAIARQVHRGRLPAWLERPPEDMLINFAGPPGHFQSEQFSQVLSAVWNNDAAYLKRFEGQAVLVGATSLRMQDLYPTPFSTGAIGASSATLMPGVEIHANALHTLLTGTPIRQAPAGLLVGLLFALGLGGAQVFKRLHPWAGLAALAAAAVAFCGLSLALFALGRVWLDVVAALLLLGSLWSVGLIHHFARAELGRRLTRQTFERYVSPDIVDELLRRPDLTPKLGGEKREVSVLFSDVRNFTTISERLPPEAVVEFLNAYLTAMADVILERDGCIDKYIGDAILAVWGNVKPMPVEVAARQAVRAALAMQAKVEELRPHWEAQGYPRIDIGVGVNTGEAVVGNIGSPRKLEFGVIGDSINVASRLEGLTKQYGGALLVSGRTRELLGPGFDCTFLEEVKVKGREQAVPIYRVNGEAKPAAAGAEQAS